MGGGTFSTFWTGRAGPYQQLCLTSWIAHGFDVVVYTPDTDIVLPAGAQCRRAEEILDRGGQIYRYKSGFGAGSPSLHSNLFRYKLLERGEWWLDTDVVMLRDDVPALDFFLARQASDKIGIGIMRLPADSPVISEAIRETEAVIDEAKWGQVGPDLITRLVNKYGLDHKTSDRVTAYEIGYPETIKFFDPAARDEVEERVAPSTFVHLWNEVWNAIGFPQELGPPEGSYLDELCKKYIGTGAFQARVPVASIKTWWRNRERRITLERELKEARAKIAAFPMISFRQS